MALRSPSAKDARRRWKSKRAKHDGIGALVAGQVSCRGSVTSYAQAEPKRRLCCTGGALFFYHQLGIATALSEQGIDLSQARYVGASAGSLTAVLCRCGVDFNTVVRHAYELALRQNVYEKPLGLATVWGALIREWLHDLLPDDAASRCSGSVRLLLCRALPLPPKRLLVDEFKSNVDLVEACMASCHLPFFLNGYPLKRWRGSLCIDGSLFARSEVVAQQDVLDEGDNAVLVNPYADPWVLERKRSFLRLTTLDGLFEMVERGREFTLEESETGVSGHRQQHHGSTTSERHKAV